MWIFLGYSYDWNFNMSLIFCKIGPMKMKTWYPDLHWFDLTFTRKTLVDTNFKAGFAQHIQNCKHFGVLFIASESLPDAYKKNDWNHLQGVCSHHLQNLLLRSDNNHDDECLNSTRRSMPCLKLFCGQPGQSKHRLNYIIWAKNVKLLKFAIVSDYSAGCIDINHSVPVGGRESWTRGGAQR